MRGREAGSFAFLACVSCIFLGLSFQALPHLINLTSRISSKRPAHWWGRWGSPTTNNQQASWHSLPPLHRPPISICSPLSSFLFRQNSRQPTQPPLVGATIMTPAPPVELVDNQDASPLFNIPLELRRAIYANLAGFSAQHIHSVAGSDGSSRLRFTPCIAPGASDQNELDGSERCPDPRAPGKKYPIVSPIFRRRLLSSWGPHWMCEELALHPRDCGQDVQAAVSVSSDYLSHLRVCKRM